MSRKAKWYFEAAIPRERAADVKGRWFFFREILVILGQISSFKNSPPFWSEAIPRERAADVKGRWGDVDGADERDASRVETICQHREKQKVSILYWSVIRHFPQFIDVVENERVFSFPFLQLKDSSFFYILQIFLQPTMDRCRYWKLCANIFSVYTGWWWIQIIMNINYFFLF